MYHVFISLFLLASAVSGGDDDPFTNPCGELCGDLSLPYPFHLNSSCGPPIEVFRLSCSQNKSSNSSLYLTLGTTDLRVISFLSSTTLLLDYSTRSSSSLASSPCGRWFADLNHSAGLFDGSPFFAVTADNVLSLYDCQDSSVCRPGCAWMGGAAVTSICKGGGFNQECCYPLSDGSVWKVGHGFSSFVEYGCRGFSSWVAPSKLVRVARRGIEVEWAVPTKLAKMMACVDEAARVNATAVKGGYRCTCGPGLAGDGFAQGIGCFKACRDGGEHSTNGDCCKGMLCKKGVAILVGVLISALFIAVPLLLCFFTKLTNRCKHHPRTAHLPKILGKACRIRLFTYQELNVATNGFNKMQQLNNIFSGTIHMGVMGDGSLVAVEKVNCGSELHFKQVWDIIESLTQVSHKNIAGIIGCCISSTYSLFLVHEFFAHGTLQEHLHRNRGSGIDWYQRVNVAVELASALSFLQSEISPSINIHDLKSSEIFFDAEYSIKIASFKFLSSRLDGGSCSYEVSHDARCVNSFGLLLLELISGSRKDYLLELTLLKIKERRLHEIVDPFLRFGELLPVQSQQIERIANFAVQCLSIKVGERVSMVGIAKEFIQIVNDEMEGTSKTQAAALEVTFSNSSLLQMVSMSPDSIYVS